ncbi:MAG: glycogen debranching enzyme GlgX, partial [Nitrospinaceae bacterium]|nr:glycogen debranching enzyme GlgX [Nitrospinaceae bacterium]NIR55841.1 glycogen debranching enzyme GlgX [Nitrospinaceae bacterium]NIS86294.1 glycogen debranching enzyme GlgX [Nitrospinaceae bacterium]NIT83123.1 glycogen debranching enzyme GlgX [Nitrospinaceae bacterium]NIU45333.1 glycogen debranching enzyme GlgX [Nitrospinaceae bacterium]
HDGFTLHDLVSYNSKHNEANREDNRDGTNDNYSWNCGAEGPTRKRGVNNLRARQKRNLMATLLLSQGVPFLLGGDELGRSQQGNNNAYCQDNELNWYSWDLNPEQKKFLDFIRRLIQLRKTHPVFTRRKFFQGKVDGKSWKDITWISPSGREMTDKEWETPYARCLGFRLNGQAIDDVDEYNRPVQDETLLILLNAHHESVSFVLPAHTRGTRWEVILDTSARDPVHPRTVARGGRAYPLKDRTLAVFILQTYRRPS